jgi:predicted nuclease of predicted toxin-antitoxin system
MSDSALKFLADESCDHGVVIALRAAGYDVVALSEITSQTIDSEVIAQAYREGRVLLTEDKDFGQLVFASQSESAGVILIRFPGNARKALTSTMVSLVRQREKELPNAFVVVQPGQIRISAKK